MNTEFFISIYLDKRRKNKKEKYPVRLRVFTPIPRKQKLYSTPFDFTTAEFNAIWNPITPKSDYNKALRKEYRKKLQRFESLANSLAGELNPFTFEEFERRLFRKSGDSISIKYHFIEVIADKRVNGQIGSAVAYESSMKSISEFAELNMPFDKLTFYDVNESWLNKYQKYMTEDLGKSLSTVGVYLRHFRAVFKKAIATAEVPSQIYPFGVEKNKYTIPGGSSVKKVLTKEQMAILISCNAMTQEQEKARDFWLFSYACSGMNIKDIALLKYKDIQDDKFSFVREKTKRTTKGDPVRIKVSLNEFSKSIVEKYGTDSRPDGYVFDIIAEGMTPQEMHQKVGNFNRFINQNLKKLCKANDLPEQISVNWARHTHATLALRRGSSMEFVGSTLGHKNFSTTQRYFGGFEDDAIEELSKNNMDFD